MVDNKSLSYEQQKQEDAYCFPYHYIPMWSGWYFSQVKNIDWGYSYIAYLNVLVDLIIDMEFDTFLDIGCGDGRLLFELSQKNVPAKLAGVDYSTRAVTLGKAILPEGIKLFCGDIKDEDLINEEFDLVSLIETLEHIHPDEIGGFLAAVHRVVRPGGKLILTVPSDQFPVSKKHYQHFNEEKLTEILSPYFDITCVKYLNRKHGMFMRFLHKFMTNRFFILYNEFLLRHIYWHYCKNYLYAEPDNCMQFLLVCNKK